MVQHLTVATSYVLPDEKVWAFAETWQRVPGLGDRRVQRIQVKRGDALAVYEEDVGSFDPDKDHIFSAPMCFFEYSVAEMKELAELSRDNKPLREPEEHMDILGEWLKDLDEAQMRRDHKSTSRAYFRKERA